MLGVLLVCPSLSLSLAYRPYSCFLKGHEIVATIAEMYLYDSTRDAICDILSNSQFVDDLEEVLPSSPVPLLDEQQQQRSSQPSCHLAKIASWADKIKYRMRWSSALHYVNGNGDHPPSKCVFGEQGWQGAPRINVLSAIQNTTQWLLDGNPGADEALKFLVHFMGDMHMPLHLTGRNKGGNGGESNTPAISSTLPLFFLVRSRQMARPFNQYVFPSLS